MSIGSNPREPVNAEPQPEPSAVVAGASGLVAPVRAAIWFGLVAGFVELVPVHLKTWLLQYGIYRKNPHLIWMIPASLTLIFAVTGALLEVMQRAFPRLGRRYPAYLLCTLALLAPLLAVPGMQAVASLILAIGIASWIVPFLLARAERFDRLVKRSLPWLALILLATVGVSLGRGPFREWWALRSLPAPPAGVPNVLLIVMDTVRADATSLHGSARDTTPNLAAIAGRGVKFERAIATAPWTLPSHASMFTGCWSWELSVGLDRSLDARYPTLAEYLGSRGYATAGFIANTVFCSTEYGLSRGFSHYEDYVDTPVGVFRSSALGWLIAKRLGTVIDRLDVMLGVEPRHPMEGDDYRKDASRINRDALRWIERQRGRPFFAFLNYLDAHDPYLLPPGKHRHFGRRPKTLADFRLLRNWEEHDKRTCSPADLVMARDAYDDCVASLDEQIGKLIDTLDRRGILKNTVVIITADHGEHFGEHQREGRAIFGHRASVYQPEIHVPLVIIAPDRIAPGTSVPGAVSLRDLPATVLDLVGLEKGASFPGSSLVNPLRNWTTGSGKASQEAVLSEFSSRADISADHRYSRPTPGLSRAVLLGNEVYHRIGDHTEAFYDLDADPGETRNLSSTSEAQTTLEQLRTSLDGLIPAPAKSP